MDCQSKLVVRCEARNKKAREGVARGFYDVRFYSFILLFLSVFPAVNFLFVCLYRLSLTLVMFSVTIGLQQVSFSKGYLFFLFYSSC